MAHGQQFPLRAPGDEKMLQEQITLVRIKARLITILHWGVQLHLLQYYMGVSQNHYSNRDGGSNTNLNFCSEDNDMYCDFICFTAIMHFVANYV